jgi:hypothetical protein
MLMFYKILIGCVALLHTAVAFYMMSVLYFIFRKRLPTWYLHIQTTIIAIAAVFHFTSGVCPLTFIERQLREKAGLYIYDGNFLNYYSTRFFHTPIPDVVIVRFIILFVVLVIVMQFLQRKKAAVRPTF